MNFRRKTYGLTSIRRIIFLWYDKDSTSGRSARKKLMLWINYYPNLMENLRTIGFSNASRSFTPAQVRLIVEALGEP